MVCAARHLIQGLTAALLLLTGFAASGPVQAQRIDDGLVAHYPFEGNLDEAAGIDTRPVVRGTLEYPTSGAIGRSLRVSGDDEIDFTGIPASTFSADFTVAWFMNLGSGDYYLFGKQGSCDSTSNYFATIADGSRLSAVFASTTASGTAVASAPRGRWAHVALVRSGSQATLYIDGVAGTPRALPTLNLGAITAPFGLGTSPCIGRVLGAAQRPVGGIDELRIYASALGADKIKALARRPSFSATPRSATVGGRSVVRASHLVVDRTYELRLVGPATSTLFRGPATAVDMSWTVTLPSLPVGSYKLYLVATLARGVENIERTIPFTVSPPLSIGASAPLQAGKRVTFTVGNLLKDGSTSVRLSYGGRVIAGPAAIEGSSRDFTVVLPTDHPSGLPANVAVRAEQLYGRIVSHLGSRSIAVAAPFTGRFATADQVSSTLEFARPRDTTTVSGKLTLADGATVSNTDLTAYWVGDNGDVTPLSIKDLVIDAQGNFQLDTLPPSLGSMTAITPQSGGRLRLVGKRVNSIGRVEWVTSEGPRFETIYDTDADTDITVRVRRMIGNGVTEALPGAYVVLSSSAPLGYALDLPGSGGNSGESVGGGTFYRQRQPLVGRIGAAAKSGGKLSTAGGAAISQIAPGGTVDLPPPPAPACGNELYRRYTDNDGRAEFPVLGGPEEESGTFQRLQSMQFVASDCGALGCQTAEVLQTFEFFVTVYTLHKGAGFIRELDNTELPTIFRVKYTRNNETFDIRNLRTGEETQQQVSANLYVEVPQITATNHIALYPPAMYHELGGVPIGSVPLRNGNNFGNWLDFSEFQESNFTGPAPDKILEFRHQPDVNGSLTSASLYLRLKGDLQVTKIGDFAQTAFVDGCNLQDLPSANQAEKWRLRIPGFYHYFWRYPQDLFFNPGDEAKVCGYIEVANSVRTGIKRNVCFRWSKPPAWANGSSFLKVNDADINEVLIEESGRQVGAHATDASLPNSFFGEPLEEPGDIDNRTNARSAKYALIGPDGPFDSSSAYAGANPEQFSQGAAGADDLFDPPNVESVVEIGEDEFQTILDTTIPLFQWYWGVPEIFSAEVYARLRLLASYYFHGTLTTSIVDGTLRSQVDILADALFGAIISIGVDVDVLFGVIVDAGASLNGIVLSEMPVKIQTLNGTDVQSEGVKPCFNFKLVFYAFVDPCTVCPTPVIELGGEPDGIIIDEKVPDNCTLYSTQDKTLAGKGMLSELEALAKVDIASLKNEALEMRAARRHPALDFDRGGNGMLLSRNDGGQIVAQTFDGYTLSPESQLTAAMGARDAQIAYFDVDRAVAVWAESTMPETQFRAVSDPVAVTTPAERLRIYAREQRLAYAVWDGDGWSAKSFLTDSGRGEGQIVLTACHDGQSGCPEGGEVLAVWQRNANVNDGDASNDATTRYRLWHARFTPDAGFATPALLASPGAGVQDITPSATYQGGRPVVVWARQFEGALEDFRKRYLAYRVLPDGVATSVAAAPAVLAPSVAAANTTSIRVAWLRADESTSDNPKTLTAGAVGTNNALYVTQATCTTTTCNFPTALVPATRDEHGRRLYGGERPHLIRGENDVILTMRVFRLENPDGQPDQSASVGDPIGTVLNTGDLMLVAPNYSTGIARVTPITADGFMHSSPAVAYNPVARVFVTGSTLRPPPFSAPFRAALKASGYQGHIAHGKALAASGNLQLTSIVEAPDLDVETLESRTALAPGAAQSTRVVVANRGVGYAPAQDGPVSLELRWNSPGGPVLASHALSDMASGAAVTIDIPWSAPVGAHADEAHILHAVLRTPDGFAEITDGNNQARHEFAGLPVPQNLGTSFVPGVPHVQLGWEEANDGRVAGYRVYRQEVDGSWTPLGASPVHGFLDLSSSFNLARTYSVSSYSARGIESERSKPVTVMPLPTQGALPELLRDGFETSSP